MLEKRILKKLFEVFFLSPSKARINQAQEKLNLHHLSEKTNATPKTSPTNFNAD
jgi:hypothetical protein